MGSKVGLGKIVTLVPTSDTVNPSIAMITAAGVVGGVALVPGVGHSITFPAISTVQLSWESHTLTAVTDITAPTIVHVHYTMSENTH